MTAPLVELNRINVSLSGSRVLSGISWSLLPGEHWAVLGANGSGKSTFLKLVRGEVSPDPARGHRIYRLGGEQRTAVGIKEQMPLVSPEAQDRYLQIEWTHRALEVIYSGFAGTDYLFRKPTPAQRAVADKLIRLLGVDGLLRRNVQELSTGELRRVLIARALVRRPKVLLLDEVCDGLDAPARRTLLRALERVAGSGTQLLFTTHRDEELIPSITHALRFKDGRIVFQGPVLAADAELEGRVPRVRRRALKNGLAELAPPVCPSPGNGVLIGFESANVYLNRARVLRGITWQMREGENWAILGGNGAGKSTFLKLVCGDIHPAAGSRVRRFEFTSRNTLWELRRRIGFVSPALQAGYREQLNAREVVASGFFASIGLLDRVSRAQWRRVDELLARFRMSRLATSRAMSYGEFRKVLLLRALVHDPRLVICDEPFDGLDAVAKRSFADALDHIASNGTRLLTVTHHVTDLPAATTHALVLEKGRIVCQGKLLNVCRHPSARRLFDG